MTTNRTEALCAPDSPAGCRELLPSRKLPSLSTVATTAGAIALYLLVFLALLWFAQAWYSYPFFVSLGPLQIAPNSLPSKVALAGCFALVAGLGISRILGRMGGDSFVFSAYLSAFVGFYAFLGLYMLCYTLQKPAFKCAFAVLLLVEFCAVARGRKKAVESGCSWSARESLEKSFLFSMAAAGLVVFLAHEWVLCAYSYELEFPEDEGQRTLAANIETAATFFDGSFGTESLAERVENAAIIALVEANYLGVEGPITITAEAIGGTALAYYDAAHNRIAIDTARLMTWEGPECVESVVHEVAHAFQRQVCSGQLQPETTETGWSGGFPDEETIDLWESEFDSYVLPDASLVAYFFQETELSAYAEAGIATDDIESRVEHYLSTGEAEPSGD